MFLSDYVELGWSVFPVKGPKWGKDYQDTKRPAIKSWEPYQYRKPMDSEIDDWEKSKSDYSLAVACGPVSGFVVIDLDTDDWKTMFPDADFGLTWKALSKRGCHYFYKWEDWLLDFSHNRSAIENIKGFDMKGLGGYVVIPNRNDPDRRWEMTPSETELEEMPSWLREFLQNVLKKTKQDVKARMPVSSLAELREDGHNRHTVLLSYVGKLIRAGFAEDEIKAFLMPLAVGCSFGNELQELVTDAVGRYAGKHLVTAKQVEGLSVDELHTKAIAELRKQAEKGIEFKTYFPTLDEHLAGLRRGELISIGGYTSHGKSLLAGTLAIKLASQGKVLYFTTEMSSVQYYTLRVMPFIYAISSSRLRHAELLPEDYARLENYPDLSLWFCDIASPTFQQVLDVCEMIQPDVVVFDHVNRCRTDKADNRNQGIAEFLIGMKTLAIERNLVAIVTAQLNRSSQLSTAPALFHFRDSGAIEMESDVAILLDKKDELGTKIDGLIAKNRHGSKSSFDLFMDTEKMVVAEL